MDCGAECSITREEYLLLFKLPHKKTVLEKKLLEKGKVTMPVCSHCGADLTEAFRRAVEPAPCTRSGVVCGFPCGARTEPYREGALPCPQMVPVSLA